MKIILVVLIHFIVIFNTKGQSTEPEGAAITFNKNKQWVQALIPLKQEQQLDSIRSRILQNYHKDDSGNRSPAFVIDGYLPQFSRQTDSLEIYTLLSFLTPKLVEKVIILSVDEIAKNVTFCNPANGIIIISFKDKKPVKKLKALSKGKNKNWS